MAVTKRKRKSHPYQAEVFVSGVRLASRCFETAAEAHRWHDETKRRFECGRGRVGGIPLGALLETYRELEMPMHAPSTRTRYNGIFKLLEASPVVSVRMEDFDGAVVDRLLDWFLAHPTATTSFRKSFVKELKVLRAALAFYRDQYDERFVIPITRRHSRRARFKSVEPRRRDYFVPPGDLNTWLKVLKQQRDPVYYLVAVFQTVTGCRIGEAAALCWDAVDFDRGLIDIRRTMDWEAEDGTKCRDIANRVKTPSSRRTLPMPPLVRWVLEKARRLHPVSTVVFRNSKGSLLFYETVRQAYNRAFKKAGLPWTATHILRHTNATLGVKAAGSEAVQVNLGHTSMRETLGYAKIHAMIENTVPEKVAGMLDVREADLHVQSHVHSTKRSG